MSGSETGGKYRSVVEAVKGGATAKVEVPAGTDTLEYAGEGEFRIRPAVLGWPIYLDEDSLYLELSEKAFAVHLDTDSDREAGA